MRVLGIIPARYNSSRFPGKPLIDLKGKSMIQRVYEGAKKSKLITELIVATDDLRILEEVKLPGSTARYRKGVLYLDFYIPQIKRAFEVHGQQHYEFTPFFHKAPSDFVLAKGKDQDKIDWCELNSISLVALKYSDSDDYWRNQIEQSF
jgi:hypothetical protein